MIFPTKSKYTFDESCRLVTPNTEGKVIMWTFTFKDVIAVSEGRRRWSKFLKRLRNHKRYHAFNGLRVFELHPGGHGLHIHVLTSCSLWIKDVLQLWQACGGGRVGVLPIAADRTGYLGKYLRKQGRSECFKGVAMWRSFGGFPALKIKDTKVESNWTRIYAYLRATARSACGLTFDKLKWHERQQAVCNVERGLVWFYGLARFVQQRDMWHDVECKPGWIDNLHLFPCPAPAFARCGIPD
jgi:hypothetical protein